MVLDASNAVLLKAFGQAEAMSLSLKYSPRTSWPTARPPTSGLFSQCSAHSWLSLSCCLLCWLHLIEIWHGMACDALRQDTSSWLLLIFKIRHSERLPRHAPCATQRRAADTMRMLAFMYAYCSLLIGRSLLRVLGCGPVQDLHELRQSGGLLPSADAGIPTCQERLDAGRMLRQGPEHDKNTCQQAASSRLGLITLHCLKPRDSPEELMLAFPTSKQLDAGCILWQCSAHRKEVSSETRLPYLNLDPALASWAGTDYFIIALLPHTRYRTYHCKHPPTEQDALKTYQ